MEEHKKKSNMGIGLSLIVVGVILFLVQADVLNWNNFWPYIMVAGGFMFFIGFLVDRNNFGLLMPATILMIDGALFIYMVDANWYHMNELWPTFILAPGVGFFLMHFLGNRKAGLWIPGVVLTTLALIFYSRFWGGVKYIPLVLIAVGLYLVISFFMEKHQEVD